MRGLGFAEEASELLLWQDREGEAGRMNTMTVQREKAGKQELSEYLRIVVVCERELE